MNKIVKKDIIAILLKIKSVFTIKEEQDISEIKDLSNHTIHNSTIFQDEDSIAIAILVYSMSKIIERNELDYAPFQTLVNKAIGFLDNDDIANYREQIKKIFKLISAIDSRLKLYVEEVITQSQIKKAGSIYAHGISIGRAAEIIGISQWELLSYIGKTTVTELKEDIINVRDRLKYARGLFL
ncbi:MAG: hypothetical protein ABIC04_01375 [Nanoarchaeota archaeon]